MTLPSQSDTQKMGQSTSSRVVSLWVRATYRGFKLSKGARKGLIGDIADAATDTDATFWLVTLLSGAIATLGLLQNSAAVVIGAMLIAPLLGPLMGLALSVAVGNARLFVQTFLILALITIGITGLAALITLAMPITPLTEQIAARTYPTVLDLFIAISSGAAAALVTGSGNHRLSASIPGVAVAVALVPPLGAAGYGLSSGPQWEVFSNSLLLFWTNLAGIVLSGLLVYLMLGFGANKLDWVLREWQIEGRAAGVSRWIGPLPRLQTIAFQNLPRRTAVTIVFVAITSIPLLKAFDQLISEHRLDEAISEVVTSLEAQPGAFVVERRIENTLGGHEVTLTTISREEIPSNAIESATESAEDLALEPISFSVVQRVIADRADYERVANTVARNAIALEASEASGGKLASRLQSAASSLALPEATRIVGTELVATGDGDARIQLLLTSASRPPLAVDTIEILQKQLARALEVDRDRVTVVVSRIGSYEIDGADPVPAALAALRQFNQLSVFLDRGNAKDALADRLAEEGVPAKRIVRRERPQNETLCVGQIGGALCDQPPDLLGDDDRIEEPAGTQF